MSVHGIVDLTTPCRALLRSYPCRANRGSVSIPAFQRASPKAADTPVDTSSGEEEEERDRPPVYEEDYNYEAVDWSILPDFVDRVRRRHEYHV